MSAKHSRYKWLLTLLRFGLCAVAIYFLVKNVNIYDHLTLRSGERVRLVKDRGDQFDIQRGSQKETIGRDQVSLIDDGKMPDVEFGLATVVHETELWPNEKNWGAFFAILIFFPASLLQGLRLVWMLGTQNVHISFWNALKLSFAGNFFNFALPGTTGGDVIKAVYITRFTHRKTEAVTAVFLDRVVGLFGLVLVAGIMITVSRDPEQFRQLLSILAIVTAGLAVLAALVFSRRLRNVLRLSQLASRMPMGDQLLRVGRATIALRQHKSLVLLSLLNTIALQFTVMLSAYFMAMAMGMRGDLPYYLISVAVGFLIAAVPIAPPQGFGVMEWAYMGFFAKTGLATPAQAVAFALAVRLIQLFWALPGVLVPLFGAHLPSKKEIQAVEDDSDSDLPAEEHDDDDANHLAPVPHPNPQ